MAPRRRGQKVDASKKKSDQPNGSNNAKTARGKKTDPIKGTADNLPDIGGMDIIVEETAAKQSTGRVTRSSTKKAIPVAKVTPTVTKKSKDLSDVDTDSEPESFSDDDKEPEPLFDDDDKDEDFDVSVVANRGKPKKKQGPTRKVGAARKPTSSGRKISSKKEVDKKTIQSTKEKNVPEPIPVSPEQATAEPEATDSDSGSDELLDPDDYVPPPPLSDDDSDVQVCVKVKGNQIKCQIARSHTSKGTSSSSSTKTKNEADEKRKESAAAETKISERKTFTSPETNSTSSEEEELPDIDYIPPILPTPKDDTIHNLEDFAEGKASSKQEKEKGTRPVQATQKRNAPGPNIKGKQEVRKRTNKKGTGPVLTSSDENSDSDFEQVPAKKQFVSTKNRPGTDIRTLQSAPSKHQNQEPPFKGDTERLEDSSSEDDEDPPQKKLLLSPIKGVHKGPAALLKSENASATFKNNDIDVRKLLEIGENIGKRNSVNPSDISKSGDDSDSDSDNSSVGWEEVGDKSSNDLDSHKEKVSISSEGIVITLPNEGQNRRGGKKKFDIQDWRRKEFNKEMRDIQVLIHKASLVCCIGRGVMVNNWLLLDDVKGIALSLLPIELTKRPSRITLISVTKYLSWFRLTYRAPQYEDMETLVDFVESLRQQLISKKPSTYDNQVFMFIAFLRSVGFEVRLMWSLQPLPLKLSSDDLIKKPKTKDDNDENNEEAEVKTCETSPDPKTQESSSKKGKKKSKAAQSNGKQKPAAKGEKVGRKIISSDESACAEVVKGRDIWAEVFVEDGGQWVSVDISSGKLRSVKEIEIAATQPVNYVLGFDDSGHIKDVTRRYASRWLTQTQKQRVESDWWHATIKPFQGRQTARDRKEDADLDRDLLNQPLPKTIGEYKGHPLYALRRHLLKFEAIYPPEPASLGYINKEPVYSRDCVKTLHTREVWSRQAKVVRIGETPYKVVKARPKFNGSGMVPAEKPAELFGKWQVEDFVPPVAKDGIVPRNAYGNVELFMDKMLPKGTVHLNLPGLNRVAKKLDIDCAPALTGFEFNRGGSHPVCEGFVVCEEFQEILLDAWNQDQDERVKKEEEKRKTRVYMNWRKLIRGVMIREKLHKKYAHTFSSKRKLDDSEPSTSQAALTKRQRK